MIYLDANATTPTLPEVWEAMRPWMQANFGNASSAHAIGRRARQALEDARERIAGILHALPEEVIFTSGATEANNLAIFGSVPETPCRLAISRIEHLCITEPAGQLQKRGYRLDWLPVNRDGIIEESDIAADTRLICTMAINHETGAIQPVSQLVQRYRVQAPQAKFHCDAAQAVGKYPIHFRELGVDTLSASGHKFHAPPGIGLLLLKKGTPFRPAMFGGHQQQGRRPGTESVPLAVGLAKALEIAERSREQAWNRLQHIRSRLWEYLVANSAPVVRNSPENGSPYVLNVSFPGCRAELLLMKLDMLGVACSTGSACSSGSLLPSPVLQAMGVPDEVLRSAMRFSWTRDITEESIDEAGRRIVQAVLEIRA